MSLRKIYAAASHRFDNATCETVASVAVGLRGIVAAATEVVFASVDDNGLPEDGRRPVKFGDAVGELQQERVTVNLKVAPIADMSYLVFRPTMINLRRIVVAAGVRAVIASLAVFVNVDRMCPGRHAREIAFDVQIVTGLPEFKSAIDRANELARRPIITGAVCCYQQDAQDEAPSEGLHCSFDE